MPAIPVAAVVSAFDLSCKMLYMGAGGAAQLTKLTGDFGPLFKVDLVTGRFCEGDCTETQPIAKITPTILFLKLADTPTYKEYIRISRESGSYESSVSFNSSPPVVTTGTCQAKPFTGFPARKF